MAALVLPEYYADLAQTTLSSSYTAGAGVIVVTTAANLSTTRQFHFMITDQTTGAVKCIGKATALTSSTFTVTMTTDANANSGDFVTITLCAAAEDQIRADQAQFGTYANLPTVAKAGDRYKQSDGPYEWVFQSGAWQAFFNGFPATVVPSTSWTSENLSANNALVSYANGYGYLVGGSSANSDFLATQYRAAPGSAPYAFTVRFQQDASGLLQSINAGGGIGMAVSAGVAFGWRDSGGKYLSFGWGSYSGDGYASIFLSKWASYSSLSSSSKPATSAQILTQLFSQGGFWIRFARDGSSNLTFSISIDGQRWYVVHTETVTTFLADATSVFWGTYGHTQSAAVSLYDWTQS
jgi:hypothetical protein